jgi:[histone H3]-dimethyl-L-lysine9 demethylase
MGSDHPRTAIVDCQTNITKDIPVQRFFDLITAPKETRGDCVWKLKDWPTDCEFREKFPALYADFMDALPVPDFTRRDGAMNIASFFPGLKSRPDIGPKMYNAFTGIEAVDGLGTTRLHMDMADAINIMLYANDPSPGVTGCAVWDIYRAEDSNAIRDFLSVRFKNYKFHDPIHSQIFYMNEAIRRELFEEKGVISHRIYQYRVSGSERLSYLLPSFCANI